MLIQHGTIYDGVTPTPYAADIRLENGKIKEISPDLTPHPGEEVFDAAGLRIYPGFVDAHSHLGLDNYGMGYEGQDYNEMGDIVAAHLRAIDSFNPLELGVRKALEGGVTTVGTGPGSANVLGGTFVTIKTVGRRVEDMVVRDNVAMKCAFGENPRDFGRRGKQPNTRASVAFMLRECLQDAIDYKAEKAEALKKEEHFKVDLGMEAMVRVIDGEIPIKAHCHRSDDICTVIRICKEFGVRATLDHCTDGHLIAEHVAKSGFPAIVGPTFGSKSKYELKNKSFDTVAVLVNAGVKVAVTTDHNVIPQESLNWLAAMYMRNGLSEADALRCITCNPADILGISDRKGRLAPGLDADLVIWDQHPLDLQAKPKRVYVRAKEKYRA